mgnify:CR=1 FL=1
MSSVPENTVPANHQSFLAFDYGLKRTGVAVGNRLMKSATLQGTIAAEGDALLNHRHPRTYGTFPRVLGHYVRQLKLLTLEQAIHRASGLPATNLSLRDRGFLREGYFADVLVFDPNTIIDQATFQQPHQYAVGMEQVFINGAAVIADSVPTGATPGRVVRGPGWTGWQ